MFPSLLTKTEIGLDPAVRTDLAALLGEDDASVATIINAADASAGMPRWIVLAVIHAFWRKANVAPQVTSSVLNTWPEIPASLEEVLRFKTSAAAEESDPFPILSPDRI